MITAAILSDLPSVRHGFFTRKGGTSSGIFASLNCGYGSGDDRDRVRDNRAICSENLGVVNSRLVGVFQEHTANAVVATEPWPSSEAPVADAIVTAAPGLAVGVLTADCAPILFADPKNGVVAAAHAGWKGAFTGIVESTVTKMEQVGAQRDSIVAAIGPCIAQQSYEVGPEFRARFASEDSAFASYFHPSTQDGHWMFDLAGFVDFKIRAAGLSAIEAVSLDTYADESRFFSYRRSCHRKEPQYGRQLSAITLAR